MKHLRLKMFNNDETNILYLKIKTFWCTFNKNALLNNLNDIVKNGLHSKNEISFTNLSHFISNIEDPTRLFLAFERFYSEVKDLKQDEVRYKKEITELKAKNDSLTAELQKSNKTISSYQFVQITTLKEIEELKKSLEEAKALLNCSTLGSNREDSSDAEHDLPKTPQFNPITTTPDQSISQATTTTSTNSQDEQASILPQQTTSSSLEQKPPAKKNENFSLLPTSTTYKWTNSEGRSSNSTSMEKINLFGKKIGRPRLHQPKPPTQPLLRYEASLSEIRSIDARTLLIQVKKRLANENLSQSSLARALFNECQANVFINKPRPWSVSIDRHKEVYLQMLMWFNDPNGIQKLRDFNKGKYNPDNYKNSNYNKVTSVPVANSNQNSEDNDEDDNDIDCIVLSDKGDESNDVEMRDYSNSNNHAKLPIRNNSSLTTSSSISNTESNMNTFKSETFMISMNGKL